MDIGGIKRIAVIAFRGVESKEKSLSCQLFELFAKNGKKVMCKKLALVHRPVTRFPWSTHQKKANRSYLKLVYWTYHYRFTYKPLYGFKVAQNCVCSYLQEKTTWAKFWGLKSVLNHRFSGGRNHFQSSKCSIFRFIRKNKHPKFTLFSTSFLMNQTCWGHVWPKSRSITV